MDAAKYVAHKLALPLYCLPIAISMDAFFTGASGHRHCGCVTYAVTKAPDVVVVDLDVCAAAPQRLRAAGLCDVLSISTGLADWRYAKKVGKLRPEHMHDPMADKMAECILQSAIDCAASAGRGEHAGLRRLLDTLCLEVTLCNQIGHSRPEEGAEHFLAYLIEKLDKSGRRYTHAELIGPGLLIIGHLHGLDTAAIREAYKLAGLSYREFPARVVKEALLQLPGYCLEHESLAHSIAHDLTMEQIEAVDVEALLAG